MSKSAAEERSDEDQLALKEEKTDLSWTAREKDLIEYQAAREREDEIANDNLRLI